MLLAWCQGAVCEPAYHPEVRLDGRVSILDGHESRRGTVSPGEDSYVNGLCEAEQMSNVVRIQLVQFVRPRTLILTQFYLDGGSPRQALPEVTELLASMMSRHRPARAASYIITEHMVRSRS